MPDPKHTLEKATMVLFNPVFKMRTTLRQGNKLLTGIDRSMRKVGAA